MANIELLLLYLLLQSYYDRTCMVVCLLESLYLDATLPLHTLLLGYTHACCYISLLILLLRLYYINAWWKLVLSRLWGECCVCVPWVCVEGEGCVDQVGVYDEPGASLAMGCYLGTPEMDTYGG